MRIQLQFKTLFRRFVRNRGCGIFGQGVIAGSRIIKLFQAAPKHGQKGCEMCQEAAFLSKQHKKAQCMSSNICRQNVSVSDMSDCFFHVFCGGFCCFLWFCCCFICVFLHIITSSVMPLPVACCQFTLGITKSDNSLSSSCFPLWHFLPFPPPRSSFNAPNVWKEFYCHLLWTSSVINVTFEDRRLQNTVVLFNLLSPSEGFLLLL